MFVARRARRGIAEHDAVVHQDSALRDIQQLVERGVLARNSAGGRSTGYSLAGL